MKLSAIIASVALAASLLCVPVSAHAQAGNAQQQKMTECNTQAANQNLSGDARKGFMASCLSTKPAAAAPAAPTASVAPPAAGKPQCKTGKPCGNSCIAQNKVCHKS